MLDLRRWKTNTPVNRRYSRLVQLFQFPIKFAKGGDDDDTEYDLHHSTRHLEQRIGGLLVQGTCFVSSLASLGRVLPVR